ncbi:GntR family transcriptional regulator [Staphylococcus saprophyticus]|uniref:GntR family transcriptional regulator n=1 Tax=Staphylococcus xylosus TaxID=1288 RepID=UPI00107400BA|nr:GntR family transcriptional regulator [Staphylococcus xylosus]MBF0812879.1 GntR family transcriptional regulator [Staphylococcus saprophyticus]TFV24502.1 GntR family transcriptional regulator [Staphylococcus saprophyticus]
MNFDFESSIPLYKQVSDQIKASILTGIFKEGEQIPSTTEISKMFSINPATVLKGMNLLVSKNIIEKRRGIGMFVLPDAKKKIAEEGRGIFYENRISPMVQEAKSLGMNKKTILDLIERAFDNE